jgi:hypothetical protein
MQIGLPAADNSLLRTMEGSVQVYFKLRFTLSYRDVEEIMKIRGMIVDHATILPQNIEFFINTEKYLKTKNLRILVFAGFTTIFTGFCKINRKF